MLQSDIITKLRSDYGFSDISLYPDVKLTEMINDALMKISQFYPKIEMDFINTVVDQTRYTISKTGLIGIKEVYYSKSSGSSSPTVPGDSTFLPSNSLAGIIKLEINAHLSPSGAEIISHDTFDLIPTPEVVEKVYYDYKKSRLITELPDIFEEDIYSLITHGVAVVRFKKASATNGMGGNPYKFDRKGNITEEASTTISETQKSLKSDYNDIVDSIKRKVMTL